MSMVERVARAICCHGYGCIDPDKCRAMGNYEEDARAAIAAMREPSEGMLEAARNHHSDFAIWQAMIDQALAGR